MNALLCLPLLFAARADELSAKQYAPIVAKNTDELRIYDGWYTALLVRGTLIDDALRVAQEARIAAITGNPATGENPSSFQVVLAASTQFIKELSFSVDGSTPWTVHLRAGENACLAPESIVETRKPKPLDMALLPHTTQWDRLFRLTFAADACGGLPASALDFFGARGQGTLEWHR